MVFCVLVLLGACGVVAGEWLIGRLDRPIPVEARSRRRPPAQVPQNVR
jgi:hypothetical protein